MQTVKPPTGIRPPPAARSRPWVWLLVLLVVGLIATSVVWLLNDDGTTIQPSATPSATQPAAPQPIVTAQPTLTAAAVPPASRTPMSSIEALIDASYVSVDERDIEAFYALRTPNAVHTVYYSGGGDLTQAATFTATRRFDLATDPLRSITRLGPPIFSGMIVAVPGEYQYSSEADIGFDLFLVEKVADGYLIAGQATIYARAPIDPEVERFLTEDAAAFVSGYINAWNEGDAEAARAAFAPDGAFWDGWHSNRQVREGATLTQWISESLWIEVVAPAEEAVVAGPFLVVPNKLINSNDRTDTSDGISLFMFEDGKIALQIFHQ
jgi:SnoaL-like domain